MNIALIGMSNIGKTWWADQLVATAAFKKIDCDALIAARLGDVIPNYRGIGDVASWMGQPYAPQYPKTSQQFIECEEMEMRDVLDELEDARDGMQRVIDTTGSVIYTRPDITERLRASTRVIYLEASPEHREKLFKSYIAEPKPVIWGDGVFTQKDGENEMEALKRCYPELLASRAKRYEKMAHVRIPFERHRDPHADNQYLIPRI